MERVLSSVPVQSKSLDGDWMCCLVSVSLRSTGIVASSSSELAHHSSLPLRGGY